MEDLILCIALWMMCGIYATGRSFAYYQGKWPSIAKESYYKDLAFSYILIAGGVISMFVALFHCQGGYGFRLK